MKAILVKEPGGRDQLYIGETPDPVAQPGEAVVAVKATALNRMDIIQREGHYPVPEGASTILGVDMAGVVQQAAGEWQVGDAVFGLMQGGGYAEFAAVPADLLWRKPENLSFEEAVAIPEVFMTAYQCLFWLGQAEAGQTVLVHAAASGVGTAAIQLLRESGASSIITAGTAEKIAVCESLGASHGINYKKGAFADKVLDATGGAGVELVLDFVGAPYWNQNLKVLKRDGRLVMIGFLGGTSPDAMDLGPVLRKRLQVIGTTLRSRAHEYRAQLAGELGEFALARFADGRMKPIVDSVFDWHDVQDAHQRMEENLNTGKIVVAIGDS